jgi:hypothetical protein
MATYMNESIIIGSERGTSRGPWPGVALVLALALVAVIAWNFMGQRAVPTPIPIIPSAATTTPPAPLVSSVSIALLDTSGAGSGKSVGCDTLELVAVPVAPTTSAAAAAVAALFAPATTTEFTNFVAEQAGLSLDSVELHEDDVHVYLSGAVTYGGACDNPRLQIQVEETVRASAPAIDEVEIFLDGDPYEMPTGQ